MKNYDDKVKTNQKNRSNRTKKKGGKSLAMSDVEFANEIGAKQFNGDMKTKKLVEIAEKEMMNEQSNENKKN